MYRVDVESKQLIALTPTGFSELGIKERFDIQEWIDKTPSILGDDFLVIAKEYTLESGKRPDLLCVDKDGCLVIVELKRDDSGSTVEWQAIKYASYCSNFLSEKIYNIYASYLKCSEFEAKKKIEEFIVAPKI